MSWSFSGVGKPAAVLAKMKADLDSARCSEPEETIKQQVLLTVETALNAFPESSAVEIKAAGSQQAEYRPTLGGPTGKFVNHLSLEIKPIHGFIG